MSYDIAIPLDISSEDQAELLKCVENGCEYRGPSPWMNFNYTYNLGRFFHDHIRLYDEHDDPIPEKSGLQVLHGMTNAQAQPVLERALLEVENTRVRFQAERTRRGMSITEANSVVGDPEFCAKYDAQNGWGSTFGAYSLLVLMYIKIVNNQTNDRTIEIS